MRILRYLRYHKVERLGKLDAVIFFIGNFKILVFDFLACSKDFVQRGVEFSKVLRDPIIAS